MKKVHTHYDNLKVARNAPIEVIRAAYKTLSQKYHPDRNPDNPEASNIMAIINGSYEVLSDPVQRKEHDEWIAEKEAAKASLNERQDSPPPPNRKEDVQPQATNLAARSQASDTQGVTFSSVIYFAIKYWYVFLLLGLIFFSETKPKSIQSDTPPYSSEPPAPINYERVTINDEFVEPYERPSKAPNGNPWPKTAGYVQGYPKVHTHGHSTVTVDNTKNDSDVFVKLVALENEKAFPVRQFFIPAFSKFTLNNVTQGKYDIRYRDLDNGQLSRAESFELIETEMEAGTQFSKYTITLYKVADGNIQTYDLAEREF